VFLKHFHLSVCVTSWCVACACLCQWLKPVAKHFWETLNIINRQSIGVNATFIIGCFCLGRQWSKTALTCWLRIVGRALDLEHYLLPPPRPAQQPPQALHQEPQAHQPPQLLPASDSPRHSGDSHRLNLGNNIHSQSLPHDSVSADERTRAQTELEAQQTGQAMALASDSPSLMDVASSSNGVAQDSADNALGSVTSSEHAQQQSASPSWQTSAAGAGLLNPGAKLQHREAAENAIVSSSSGVNGQELQGSLFLPPFTDAFKRQAQDRHNGFPPSTADATQLPNSDQSCGSQKQSPEESQPLEPAHALPQASPSQQLVSHPTHLTPSDSSRSRENRSQLSSVPLGLSQAGQGTPSDPRLSAGLSQAALDTPSGSPRSAAPSPAAQGRSGGPVQPAQAAVNGSPNEDATAAGLVANSQLIDSEELTGRLMALGLLLMLTLLLLMTGILTIPCIIGKHHISVNSHMS